MLDSIDHPVDELQFAVDNMTRDALHAQSAVSNLRGIYHDISHWDPDVLAGWELHNSSWGYLSSRAHEAFSELATCGSLPDTLNVEE
jgi:DNA polymerase elongation subunit (family B)